MFWHHSEYYRVDWSDRNEAEIQFHGLESYVRFSTEILKNSGKLLWLLNLDVWRLVLSMRKKTRNYYVNSSKDSKSIWAIGE